MPTLVAVSRCNPWLQTFYRRLIEHDKPHQVALVAAMRKLLAAIYLSRQEPPPFVPIASVTRSFEAMKRIDPHHGI
jgi:hypothetical protein